MSFTTVLIDQPSRPWAGGRSGRLDDSVDLFSGKVALSEISVRLRAPCLMTKHGRIVIASTSQQKLHSAGNGPSNRCRHTYTSIHQASPATEMQGQ